MSNDKGLLSGSITILIGAVIAIMALVRGPWQAWLLIFPSVLSGELPSPVAPAEDPRI